MSNYYNHRVMKWNKGAKEGIVAAGGQGSAFRQLSSPLELFVDSSDTLYATDHVNHAIIF